MIALCGCCAPHPGRVLHGYVRAQAELRYGAARRLGERIHPDDGVSDDVALPQPGGGRMRGPRSSTSRPPGCSRHWPRHRRSR
ncbi:Uncharacterised protein [Amycolatopsis camponoti]|uniref:Uncharacterized protein n=1 Tax=Amycolatopsis camponoti TaxID=2606593 RepID=A0A6I8LTS7_9PSEU|nr:Uncharacterised protein [Amycolatopsis camponoti]